MVSYIKNQIQGDLKRHADGLKQDIKEKYRAVNQIHEDFFVQYFVPVFSGEIKDKDIIDERMAGWYRLCGSAYNGIYIVKPDGDFFIFPPMYDLSKIKPRTKRNGRTIDSQIEEIENLSRVNPLAANRATDTLIGQTLEVAASDKTWNYSQEIKEIIAKYVEPKAVTETPTVRGGYKFIQGNEDDY